MEITGNSIFRFFSMSWLTGPIFEKELLISSRKRRYYSLRFAYVAVLGIFIAYIWFIAYMQNSNSVSPIVKVSRMAQIGIYISAAIVWFQFICSQLLAIILLSTSISNEIYHKTLGVLMTTPVNSFQIVFGKLLSKLLLIVLLIAISLPLLTIIRVFGGVPWNFVVAGLCITLSASIFTGSLSLALSIYNRQSHLVIVRSIMICVFLYAIPQILYYLLQRGIIENDELYKIIPAMGLFLINPFRIMIEMTYSLYAATPMISTNEWLLHCLAMTGLSSLIIAWSVFCVRKVGMKQITGESGLFGIHKEKKLAKETGKNNKNTSKNSSSKIRSIKGPPVIWKEVVNPLVNSKRFTTLLSFSFTFVFLSISYSLCYYYDLLDKIETHIAFLIAYLLIGLMRSATFASTSITSEKEAGTWPILLISPLERKEIAFGKIIGSFLRTWTYWLLFFVHLIVFVFLGEISPFTIIPLILLVISSALLVSSIGVLFSTLFRKSSTSSTFSTISFFIFTIPICCPVPIIIASPILCLITIITSWSKHDNIFRPFTFSTSSNPDIFWTLLFSHFSFIIYVVFYLIIAFAAYCISVSNIRYKVFKESQ